ncbi:MAG: thioredoxin family protein [Aquabacterium sp.]
MQPPRRRLVHTGLALAALAAAAALRPAAAQVMAPHAIDVPRWFSDSFLDFKDEAEVAAREGKRLLLYFGQDGCPYCRELMVNSFSQKAIVDKARPRFMAVALNIWGDREVTWVDGRRFSEKDFARHLGVQFTPTLLFLDEQGRAVARLNGYQTPARVSATLDYVAGRLEGRLSLAEHLAAQPSDAARPRLADHPAFRPLSDLRRSAGARTLAVLFESRSCAPCDELHDEGFKRPAVREWLPRLDIVRLGLGENREITTPAGQRTTVAAWARELGVNYTPSWVFFSDDGQERFRVEGYLRPFHLTGSLEYAANAGWRREPQFQRWLQAKAERDRAAGRPVEYWK